MKKNNILWRKIGYGLYFLAAAALSVAWYPAGESKNISLLVRDMGEQVRTVCFMEENRQLFTPEVSETQEEDRRLNEQMEEDVRREAQVLEDKEKEKKSKKKKKKSQTGGKFHTSANGVKILERIVEAEAGDQDVRGRRLVANVVINRVRSKQFPNTVRGVVFAHRQFSPVSNGSYYRVSVSQKTKKAVAQAIRGVDDSRGALYFMWRSHSSPGNVSWFDRELTRLFRYGCHEFFK